MSKIRHKHELLFKLLLFVCATAFVLFLMPKEGKFKYEFQENKPWVHEDLLAPFDFAINKSQAELEAEKQELIRTKQLYFVVNNSIKDQAYKKYKASYKAANQDATEGLMSPLYSEIGKRYLDTIYSTGVIELIDEFEGKDPSERITIIDQNNVSEEVALGKFFTIRSAYEYVQNDLEENAIEMASDVLAGIETALTQSVKYNSALTEKDLNAKLDQLSLVKGGVDENEKIIAKGEIVSEEKFAKLNSLKLEYESTTGEGAQGYWLLAGQGLLVLLLLSTILVFLRNANTELYESNIDLAFLLIIIGLFFSLTTVILKLEYSVYVIPYCIVPLLIRTFFGNRVALFIFIISIFMTSLIVPNPFEFIVLQSITGIITLYTVLNVNKRAELFYSSAIIFVVIAVAYVAFSLIQETNIQSINVAFFGWFAIAAGLTLLTYPLIFLFEKTFGYISDVTLLELADTNSPLLRDLNLKTPGTFQHSLQVANLAEEAIQQVGGNPLLVRVGALYHDIGKTFAPAYFIENQSTGVNPHDELGYEESADIIIGHVLRGVELAKEHNLPEQIIDFIRTHHGTTKTLYFLRMFKNDNPDEEIDESIFEYPGPLPYSKETAVLMMADSVEAASRSLKTYDHDSISGLVEGIIDSQVNQNQFINTNITFNDIRLIKKLFVNKLMNIYHIRIEYPK